MNGPTVRTRYNRGTAAVPSALDRHRAAELEATLAISALAAADDLLNNGPTPLDDDGEGLTAEDYAALDEFQAGDFRLSDARDRASYAEVAETTNFMRAYLRNAGVSAKECGAGGAHVSDADRRGACGECGAARICVDCESWVAMVTNVGLCADCALAHLEGVALSHLEAS